MDLCTESSWDPDEDNEEEIVDHLMGEEDKKKLVDLFGKKVLRTT